MKKVLIIENSLYVTGGLNAILSAVERVKGEYEFHFIIPESSAVGGIIKTKGYSVKKLPFLEISRRPITLLFYLPRLYKNARRVLRYMRQEGIGILHVNDIFNMVGCMAKRLDPSITLVNHVRLLRTSYIAPLYPYFAKQVISYADKIICVSEAVKRDLKNAENGVVIYDTPQISHHHADWNGLANPEALKILYLGNYMRGKGHEYGLKAFIEFQKLYPRSHIKFAGSVNDATAEAFKKELGLLAERAGILSKVIFGDKVTDVEKEMKNHDVVLNMSESESFSFVALEAILYGVPLVVANSGGPAEITDGGRMAVLIENKDYLAAATALGHIVSNPLETKQKAIAAKRWGTEKFSSDIAKRQLHKVYNGIRQ